MLATNPQPTPLDVYNTTITTKPAYHPINKENMDYWCQMMQEYDTRISLKYPEYRGVCSHISNIISANLRHITYREFQEQITRVAEELFHRMQELAPLGYKFVFITSDTKKSNHWVYELIMDILEPKLSGDPNINQVIYVSPGSRTNILCDYYHTRHQDRFISTYKLAKLLKSVPQPKIMFIYPDDMSYSGTQLFTGIYQIDELIHHSDYGIRTTNGINLVNIIHYPCLGYITNLAKQQLGQISNIEFPRQTETIQVLDELLTANPYPEINKGQMSKIFEVLGLSNGLHPKHALIYFDHKIADYVSVPDKIINYGWYPGSMDCCISNSLVSNPDKEYFRETRMAIRPCYKSAYGN
jgi:hypothetical protein